MTSRWAKWTSTKEKRGFSSFLAEQETPAQMAKRMGLQSDGSGGYIDPSTGQVVARTVNNELVFYDPQGGAISAQSDGAQLTQAQPSWRDPVTGQMTVPPGQPESPEEISAVPNPVPAQAPAGYSLFMNKKKKEMYAAQATPEQEAVDDIQQEEDPKLGMEEGKLTYKELIEMAFQPPQEGEYIRPGEDRKKPVESQGRGKTDITPSMRQGLANAPSVWNQEGKPNPKVNLYRDPNSSNAHKNEPGKSKPNEMNENATLQMLYRLQQTEQRAGGAGNLNPQLLGEALKYYQTDAEKTTTRRGETVPNVARQKAALDAAGSALKGAKLIAHYIQSGQAGNDDMDYAFGKFGGQSTDIPDEFRSNLYDDLMDQYFMALGMSDERFAEPSTTRGRNLDVLKGYKESEIRDAGRQVAMKLFGADSGNNLDDYIQSADIFAVRKSMEEAIRNEIDDLSTMMSKDYGFSQSDDYNPEDSVRHSPEMYVNLIRTALAKHLGNKDLVPVSLKTIGGNSMGSLSVDNQSVDDTLEFMTQDMGNPHMRMRLQAGMKGMPHDVLNLGGLDMSFPGIFKGKWSGGERSKFDGYEGEDITDDYKIGFDFQSTGNVTGAGGETFKVEPIYSGDTNARVGIAGKGIIEQLIQDHLGEGLDDDIPNLGNIRQGTGKDVANFPNIDKFVEMIQDLHDNPSDNININNDEYFTLPDGTKAESAGDWMRQVLEMTNQTDEEMAGDEQMLDRKGFKYDRVNTRKQINAMLKNLKLLTIMRNSDRNGDLNGLMAKIIGAAAKLNTEPEDLRFPRATVK